MTADLYATATGLIERSAAAYVSGVPEDAADDGLFGPASVAWRVSTDLASPVAGLRSLLMQALHPLAMAGVDQHSGWRREPVGRLAATSAYLATITFGERAVAARAATRVPAVRMRRAIPRSCCGCTRRWSTPSWPPEAWWRRRFPRRTATATSRR